MNFLEKDLEDILYNSDQNNLWNRGLYSLNYDLIFRQVNLGEYGIADIVTVKYDYGGRDEKRYLITIYELKQHKIGIKTLLQASRYFKGIQRYIEYGIDFPENATFEYKIVLIGRQVDSEGDFVFLADFADNISCYVYTYEFDGIKFKIDNGYYINDASYPDSTHGIFEKCMKELPRLSFNKRNKIIEPF